MDSNSILHSLSQTSLGQQGYEGEKRSGINGQELDNPGDCPMNHPYISMLEL